MRGSYIGCICCRWKMPNQKLFPRSDRGARCNVGQLDAEVSSSYLDSQPESQCRRSFQRSASSSEEPTARRDVASHRVDQTVGWLEELDTLKIKPETLGCGGGQ